MSEMLSFFAGTGISTVSLVALGRWLVKNAVKQVMDRDLEAYKSEMQKRVSSELAQFNNALSIFSKRREIEYSWLYQERAKVIRELYSQFTSIYESLGDIESAKSAIPAILKTYSEVTEQQCNDSLRRLTAKANALITDAKQYSARNKIFFTVEISSRIKELNNLLSIRSGLFERLIEGKGGETRKFMGERKSLEEIVTEAKPLINAALSALEVEFQKLLVVSEK